MFALASTPLRPDHSGPEWHVRPLIRGRCGGYLPELLLRLVCLLVGEDAFPALPNLVGYPVSLLVEAATGPLVDLFLALGKRLVRSVAEPFRVHGLTASSGEASPKPPESATATPWPLVGPPVVPVEVA
jgi:hypothetical protein